MKLTAKKNDGVSPVIGTILLVAITVVLVAIISAVVMGMAGDVGNTHVVGLTVAQGEDDKTVVVTLTGGDISGLTNMTVYNGETELKSVHGFIPFTVQPQDYISTTSMAPKASISVVGIFTDGNQTIYTGTLNIA
ncbi:MAG TPA: type IV pilin N-terminal domain-containing protein [Methanocorpusculum sp.]|nr:type IV pilin N-terminal domain-containing protein [Methanocorpusculum sp.]